LRRRRRGELLDGLVGYWRLNDGTGSTTARDWSSWGNNGTLTSLDAKNVWVNGGPEGIALDVQGKGYVNVPDSSSIDSITTQVTVAAWISLEQMNTDYATAISRQIADGYGQLYHLSITKTQNASLIISPNADAQTLVVGTAALPLQTWIHLAGTWDGNEARLYVNGSEVASKPVSGPFVAETNPVVLGGNGNGAARMVTELVPGRLGDIMLYRRSLSADEIARLAKGPLLPPAVVRLDGGPG
jgi:hypothetical protein